MQQIYEIRSGGTRPVNGDPWICSGVGKNDWLSPPTIIESIHHRRHWYLSALTLLRRGLAAMVTCVHIRADAFFEKLAIMSLFKHLAWFLYCCHSRSYVTAVTSLFPAYSLGQLSSGLPLKQAPSGLPLKQAPSDLSLKQAPSGPSPTPSQRPQL